MDKLARPVAIVGMSLRYPGFCGPAAFFDSCRFAHPRLIRAAPKAVRPYLQDHPRAANHPYRISSDTYGSIRDISWIDARRFRVPPSDIDGDPSPFICLQVASEALLDYQHGRSDECIPRQRTGVVIGRGDHPHRGLWSALQGAMGFEFIRELLLERSDIFSTQQIDALSTTLLQRMKPYPNPSLAAGLVSNVISGLVANRLDLQGPNFLVDAACTSAIVAIQQAVRSLYEGESDLMLVGASQATMEVPIIQMFSVIGAISKHDIQPFNSHIDGTLLSEGVGFVALKRLDDARCDGDRIYAVIRGLGLASDGNDTSILAPSSRGQTLAMRRAYEALDGIQPDDIGFLEAHATGINLGDQTELNSIRAVFRPHNRRRPLAIGALKSLIGHSIPASGMASLIRATYAVAFGVYPISRCDSPTDRLTSLQEGLFLPSVFSPWYELPSVPRRAAINCFGFGGINGHLVLEQEILESDPRLLYASGLLPHGKSSHSPSTEFVSDTDLPRSLIKTGSPVYLICLSFNDSKELQDLSSKALDCLPDMEAGKYTSRLFSAGLSRPGTYRLGLVDRDLSRLQSELEALRDEPDRHSMHSKPMPEHVADLAVMIPGEALIPFGYLSELSRFIPSVKALLEFVDGSSTDSSILADCLHPAWTPLLSESAIHDLQRTANHHDSATKTLFVVSIAYCGLLRSLGLEPSAFVGHSTGEINALMLAGGLQCSNETEVQSILRSFAELYADTAYLDSVVEGTVVLVAGLSDELLADLLDNNDDVYLVSDNSPSHRLVFSSSLSFEALATLISGYGGLVLPTQLTRSYHTPLFESGANVMRRLYDSFPLVPFSSTVYSCCSTEPYDKTVGSQVDLLVRQWMEPVRFRQALLNMYRDGYRCFLELNANKTLVGFAESTFHGFNDVTLLTTGTSRGPDAIDSFAQAIVGLWKEGLNVNWDNWDSLFAYPDELSLPKIERPAGAVTIQHDLHRFEPDDFRAVWDHFHSTDPMQSSSSVLSASIDSSAHSKSFSHCQDSSTRLDAEALRQHQQTMRRALDSMDGNTLLILDKLRRRSG